jgi:hypothetical protein
LCFRSEGHQAFEGKEMAVFIFFVDLLVFLTVIACAASLLRKIAKKRAAGPHSDVVHPCGKLKGLIPTRWK